MSIRQELPYTGPPIARLSQQMADVRRQVDKATQIPVQRGLHTASLVAASGLQFDIQGPGTGPMAAVATPLSTTPRCIVSVFDQGSGVMRFFIDIVDGTTHTFTVGCYYEIWPLPHDV